MSTLGMLAQAGTGATFLQTLVKAVALGCVYMIMGLGFVIIFKGTQVLNFAAGALSMTGAMVLTILVADGGLPFLPLSNPLAPDEGVTPGIPQWLLNVGLALLIAALIGLVVERIAIRPMVGQPLFAMAVITLGVELAIRPFNLDATALTGRSLNVPWGAESWEVAGAIVPKSYVAAMIFAAVADEEAGSDKGAVFLVENHPELVRAEYVLNEVGGHTLYMGDTRFYPIQVSEKGICWFRLKAIGEPGHGSMPHPGNPVLRIARAIEKLGSTRLPQHNTEVVEGFLKALAGGAPFPRNKVMALLLHPAFSNKLLDVLGDRGAIGPSEPSGGSTP